MNKEEFLGSLDLELKKFSPEEKRDIVYDYEEHFTLALGSGKTEDEVCRELGDPRTIAKQYKANHTIEQAASNPTAANVFRALFATLSLGLFNLIFILGPFIGVCGVLFGFFAAGIAILISGIAVTASPLIDIFFPNFVVPFCPALATFFFGIGITAVGILFTICVSYIAKGFFKLTLKYLRLNAKIIAGRG